jgi:hypothetical protein
VVALVFLRGRTAIQYLRIQSEGISNMKLKIAAMSAFALALTACAQPEPVPVNIQPTFDKRGTASCPAGYQLATTEAGATVCAPTS